jgi:5,10-methylenetetrahydromethanopterin reductase
MEDVGSSIRTSVWLFPDRPVSEIVEAARAAERSGLDVFWLGDEGVAREPFTTLATVAAATRRIELGVSISNPYLRHPALTASTAATLAEAAGRRIHLGFGRGGRAALAPVGVVPSRPLASIRRAIALARAVLSATPTEGFQPGPYSMPQGQVSLWIGGRGPRIASLAGEIADGFIAAFPKPMLGPIIALARGIRPVEIVLCLPLILDEEHRERIRPYLPLSLLDAAPGTSDAAGLPAAHALAAAAALAANDLRTAASYITDEVIASVAVDAPAPEAARELADLAVMHQVNEIMAAISGDDLALEVTRCAEVLLAAAREADERLAATARPPA